MVFRYVNSYPETQQPDIMGSIAAACQIIGLAGGIYDLVRNLFVSDIYKKLETCCKPSNNGIYSGYNAIWDFCHYSSMGYFWNLGWKLLYVCEYFISYLIFI